MRLIKTVLVGKTLNKIKNICTHKTTKKKKKKKKSNFRVNTAILNTIDIFSRWLGGTCWTLDIWKDRWKNTLLWLFIQISCNNWQKATWTTILENTWIYHYFLNGIGLDLDLDNSCWIKKMSNFATNMSNFIVLLIA